MAWDGPEATSRHLRWPLCAVARSGRKRTQLSEVAGDGLLIAALALLLLASGRCLTGLLLMHFELGIRLFLVPLETGKVRIF